MAWPTGTVSTTNVDAGNDNPRLARADIDDAFTKLNQIIEGPAVFETRAGLAAATVPANVPAVRTSGYTTKGDGGGALYARVGAEPVHPFKVQSADLAWWEGVTDGGEVRAEQFGAVNGATADNLAALNDAFDYVRRGFNRTLVARAAYKISDTLTFPNGVYGFKGPDRRAIQAGDDSGFVWGGGNNKPIVELLLWGQSRCTSLVVTNRSNNSSKATGVTGILAHNPDGTQASITNLHYDFIGIYGCNVGLQVGDFTNDGYDSNWEQNVIENIHFYDVANPFILDSNDIDNLIFKTFHNGGPTALSAHVGTRSHIIHMKRGGHGHVFDYIFSRVDEMTVDNAAIRIDDGSIVVNYANWEGPVACRLVDINSNVLTRSQSVLRSITGIEAHVDSSGRSMLLAGKSGITLMDCTVAGDIECNRPVTAYNTVLKTGAKFTGTAAKEVVQINTQFRNNIEASEITSGAGQVDHGSVATGRDAFFNSAVLNSGGVASEIVVDNRAISAGIMDTWQIIQRSANAIKAYYRVFVYRIAGGNIISSKVLTDFDDVGGVTITVTDNGDSTYDISIANGQANDKEFAGYLANRDRSTI